jgi:3-dehydroquinate dehydratase-2
MLGFRPVASALLLAAALHWTPVQAQQTAPSPRLRILVLHGPNLDLLGRREPAIYGSMTLKQIDERLAALARELNVELVTLQSNEEGALINAFHAHIDDVDGAIINAAGYSMNSVALHDAIKAMPFPTIEVHISNLGQRDEIHNHSVLTAAVRGTVMGLGWHSYTAALRGVVEIVREEKASPKGSLKHD